MGLVDEFGRLHLLLDSFSRCIERREILQISIIDSLDGCVNWWDLISDLDQLSGKKFLPWIIIDENFLRISSWLRLIASNDGSSWRADHHYNIISILETANISFTT